jgi:hypothetical protein
VKRDRKHAANAPLPQYGLHGLAQSLASKIAMPADMVKAVLHDRPGQPRSGMAIFCPWRRGKQGTPVGGLPALDAWRQPRWERPFVDRPSRSFDSYYWKYFFLANRTAET